ncbi:MAG: glycoside hydrolase [Mycobacterium sp.]|nr:glycoside hydrolase [Mycobacterium sp.]
MSPQGVTDAVMAFMDAVSADFRHDGDIYTGAWFWNPGTLNSGPASRYALWVSNYTTSPNIPYPWTTAALWQYTDKEAVARIPVELLRAQDKTLGSNYMLG